MNLPDVFFGNYFLQKFLQTTTKLVPHLPSKRDCENWAAADEAQPKFLKE